MNRSSDHSDSELQNRRESLEGITQAFSAAWQAADSPLLSAFLPPRTHRLYRESLLKLITIDIDMHCRCGRPTRLETYLESWPALGIDAAALAELLEAECLCQAIYGALPSCRTLIERFPAASKTLDLAAIKRTAIKERRQRSYLGSERFFLLREVGQGGMGVVYAAWDRQRSQLLALKVLPVTRPDSLYYFKQEFRRLTEFVHPHLAAPYELLSVGGCWFFTMELIDGLDFIGYLQGPRPQREVKEAFDATQAFQTGNTQTAGSELEFVYGEGPERQRVVGFKRVRELLLQLADALDALHLRGILHRDLKPSNVMVRQDGRLIVLDFGLSTKLSSQPSDEACSPGFIASSSPDAGSERTERRQAGTFAYMSPEQTLGQPLTEVSDWYAVGVMLFLALTGKLPFRGTRREIFQQKQAGPPPDPGDERAGLPADLREICLGLLQSEPPHRWNSEKMRQALPRTASEHSAGPTTSPLPSIPFLGRARQLALLRQAYQAVLGGQRLCVHVFGPSGVGKSRLVNEFLHRLPVQEKAVILTGRCFESESVPFKGLDTIIDSLCAFLRSLPSEDLSALLPLDVDALAQMFPVLSRVNQIARTTATPSPIHDAHQMRRRGFAALRELLRRLSDRFPVVMAIDDLQWGDADSAAVLVELLRPADAPRLLLLAVYRSEYRHESECLDILVKAGEGVGARASRRDILVDPLSQAESRQMATHLLAAAALDATHADAIACQARGSPYLISEMAEYARHGCNLQDASTATSGVELDAVLQTRLLGLPDETRRLLEIVAVAGQPLSLRTAFEAAEVTSADYDRVATLRSQHLLRTHSSGRDASVCTYHDMIRERIVAHLEPQQLTTHHGHIADALERAGTVDPEQIAVHFDAAQQSERAGHYYTKAADEAARKLAFNRAARLYQRCFEILSLDATERRSLLTKWGDALANAGRGPEAGLQYEAALLGAGREESLELRRRAAYQYCISGQVDRGREMLRELLRGVGSKLPRTPAASLASLLLNRGRLFIRGSHYQLKPPHQIDRDLLHRIDTIWTASAGLSMFDVVTGASFQTQGCLLALKAGEPFRLARALGWEAAHLSNIGGRTWPRTQRLLREARQLSHQSTAPYAHGWLALCEGIVNFTNGRWQEAQSQLERAEQKLYEECRGVAWEVNTARAFTLWTLSYLGEWKEMRRRAELFVAEAVERGDRYAATTHSAFSLPMGQLAAGDAEGARETIAEALSQCTESGFHVQHYIALMCLTYIDLSCGQAESAWDRIQQQWPLARRSQLLRVQVLRSFLTHLRGRAALAAAAAGISPRQLRRQARGDAKRVLGEKMPYCTPHGQHLLAGVALGEAQQDRAIRLLIQAMEGYQRTGMEAFATALRHRLGMLLEDDEGVRMMEDAEAYFQEKGVIDVPPFIDALAVSGPLRPARALSRCRS